MALSNVELLTDAHRLEGFECGKSALDSWLADFAGSNQARGFTRVLVVHDGGQVVGYYGLAPTVIEPNSAPRAIRTGRPPDPIPRLLIGQLAVDRRHAGRGIGSALVKDALQRCVPARKSSPAGPSSSAPSKPRRSGGAGVRSGARQPVGPDAFDRRYPSLAVGPLTAGAQPLARSSAATFALSRRVPPPPADR